VIFAGTNGYLDACRSTACHGFEAGCSPILRSKHADVLGHPRQRISRRAEGEAQGRARRFRQDLRLITGLGPHGLAQGLRNPHRLGEGDAEDHQGHADGRGGEAAPRAGTAEAARPYAERMGAVLANARGGGPGDGAPALLAGTGKDRFTCSSSCTAERGLCGGFNSNHRQACARQGDAKLCSRARRSRSDCVGKKGRDSLRRDYRS
jgi:hypothetical protein